MDSFYEKVPTCAASANRRGEKTREGAGSGVTRLDRMKHGSGIKGRDDRLIFFFFRKSQVCSGNNVHYSTPCRGTRHHDLDHDTVDCTKRVHVFCNLQKNW
jgi:hypothetical protein